MPRFSLRKVVSMLSTRGILMFLFIANMMFMVSLLIRSQQAVDSGEDVKYFVGIKSRNTNFELRASVRRSWLRYFTDPESEGLTEGQKRRFDYKFFVGAPSHKKCRKFSNCTMIPMEEQIKLRTELDEEARKYGDLIVLDAVPDYYGNLTKKMMATFLWADNYQASMTRKNFDYFIGFDDDVYPRLDLLEPDVFAQPRTKLYMGKVQKNIKISGGNAKIYPIAQFPYFVTGMTYVLSMDLLRFVVSNREQLNMYPHDDCALGIWLLPISKTYVDRTGVYQYKGNDCDEKLQVRHPASPEEMEKLYSEHQKHIGRFCPKSMKF